MKYILDEDDLDELIWDDACQNEELLRAFEINTISLYEAVKEIPDKVFDKNSSVNYEIPNKRELMNDLVQNLEIDFYNSLIDNIKKRLREYYLDKAASEGMSQGE